MQKAHEKDGLVILGVTLDNPKTSEKDFRDRTIAYLAKQKVPFRNVWLNATPTEWQTKFRLPVYPGMFVFNRENKFVLKWPVLNDKGEEEEPDYDKVMKVVRELLRK